MKVYVNFMLYVTFITFIIFLSIKEIQQALWMLVSFICFAAEKVSNVKEQNDKKISELYQMVINKK